jgi:anti-sigma factor ChrR (cupin superfamily)
MEHREATELLLDLVAGRLDGQAQDAAERHIAGCGDCRAWVETYNLLGATLAADAYIEHPDSRLLALCAVRSDEEFEPDRANVRRHLEICPQCRRAIDLVRAAVRDASPMSEPAKAAERSQDRVPAWMLAVAASLAVIAIGTVLVSGVRRGQPRGTRMPEAVATVSEEPLEARPDVPPAEFSEPEIEGKRLIESEGGLVISRTHIKGGAEVTIRAGRSVAFGNGFQVGPQARLAVGGGSVGGEPKSREAQNG